MSGFYTCRAFAPETGGGSRIGTGRKQKVVDIHCHLSFPEVERLMQPHYSPDKDPAAHFYSAATQEYNRGQFQEIGRKLATIEVRLAEMDRLGVDIQAVSPSPGQYYYWSEPELGRDAARRINDGMAEAVGRHPDRFVGLGTVPMQAPELAVAELRRAVNDLGLRGIELSSHVGGRELADPLYRPFFAAAEELDVLIFIHPLGFTQGQRLSEHYFNNVLGNPIESTIAVGHLIFGGVLARYPGLKICVAHGGGYLPTYAGRMEHAYHARADCRQVISEPPSTYLKMFYFDTLTFDREHLAYLVQRYGADHLLLGTDYPFDMSEPDPVGFVSGLGSLDEAARDRILGGNALRLLKIEP